MNKFLLSTLIAIALLGVAVAANTSVIKKEKDNTTIMTTEQLWKSLEEARDNRLPQTAKPYIEELRKRITDEKDTQSMFRLLSIECDVRDNCFGEYDDKTYSNDEWHEKQIKEARALWSPIREVLLANLYCENKNGITLEEILVDNEDILTATPLDEYNSDKNRYLEGATLWDAIVLSLPQSFNSDSTMIQIWQRHIDKTGGDVSANLLSLRKIQTLNADEEKELADMRQRSKSESAKCITTYAEAISIVNSVLTVDCDTDEEIAQCKSLVAKAIDMLTPLANTKSEFIKRLSSSAKNTISQLSQKLLRFEVSDKSVDPRLKVIPVSIDYFNMDTVDFVLYPNEKVNNVTFTKEGRSYFASHAVKTWSNYKLTTKGNPLKKLIQTDKLPLDDVLPCGEYRLAAYRGETLLSSESFAMSQLAVTGLSGEGKTTVIVADAMNGQPKVGATVSKEKTDKDGVVTLRNDRTSKKKINDGNESLDWSIYSYSHGRDKLSKENYFEVVTDRGIYRPGQVINYKVWSYKSLNGDMNPVIGHELNISLRTADGKRHDMGYVKTNAWGTVSGTITIPEDVYCGGASVVVAHKYSHNIQIDEYKRTGIDITFPTIESIVKVGDVLSVKGVATQANGNPVSNANVVWTVLPGSVEKTATTDDNGEFLMDVEIKYGHTPVNVKVTDQKGETAEALTQIQCTKEGSSFGASFANPVLVQGEKLEYSLSVKNDNNGDWTSDVTTTIHKLNGNELSDLVSENTKSVTGRIQEVCPTESLTPGAYRFSFKTTLANDSVYTYNKDIIVIAKEDCKQSGLPTLWKKVQNSAVVNEKVSLRLASSHKESMAYVFVVADAKVQSLNRVDLSEESKSIVIPMPKSVPLEGSIRMIVFLVGQGEIIGQEVVIRLKEAKPALPFALKTSRDISSPKAHEKWTLQLGDSSIVAPEAEVVASMYDARLDKFSNNSWNNLRFYENRYHFYVNTFHVQPIVDCVHNFHPGYIPSIYHIADDVSPRVKEIVIRQSMLVSEVEEFIVVGYGKRRVGASNKSAMMPMSAMSMEATSDNMVLDCVEEEGEPIFCKAPQPSPMETDTPRDNFSETVFFYPHLVTAQNGLVEFEFDLPDNLTAYKFQALAHTKDMQLSYMTQKLNVRKELSVTMGAPRFAVEGDIVTLTALVECYDKSLSTVDCDIVVKDADGKVYSSVSQKVDLNGSTSAQTDLKVTIPSGVDNLTLSVSAKGNNHQDMEITTMQVAKRCVETHESLPFVVVGKNYTNNYTDDAERIERQKKYGNGNLTFKYNSNAFVEIVDALPYLNEEWSKSADTYLGKVESSAIALLIKSRPDVQKAICSTYKLPRLDDEGYNTPWHSDAVHMDKHTADIKDILTGNKAQAILKSSLRKLHGLKKHNGSIAWFPGMEGSDYMTISVAEMLGRMIQMGLISGSEEYVGDLCNGAQRYMDKLISDQAEEMRKHDSKYVGYWTVELLYARALMPGRLSSDAEYIIDILKKHAQKDMSESFRIRVATLYNQIGAKDECELIVRSLIENLQHVKPGLASVYVHRFFYPTYAEIYSQSMLTILLGRMDAMGWNGQNDDLIEVRNQLLNWLIFQKRSSYWFNRQSTSVAVLAVMGANADMTSTDAVSVGADSYTCTIDEPQLLMPRKSIEPVKVSKSQEYPSWGAWQWTETTPQDELIETGCDELKVSRTIYVERNGKFEKLEGNLKVGDVIKVELTLRSTVDMSFVHLRDHKAASFEHKDQTSNYVFPLWWWRADRSVVPHYYQPHDTHIDFFIEHLAKGVNKLSYEATVTNAGDLSAGFAEVQCVFTPELVAKSAGSRIVISNINK